MGLKTFIEIFDDVFSQCIDVHKDKFFHPLSETDVLCRAVKGTGHRKDRFIPWPSKTYNRWNPPGTQFLYLSFGTEVKPYTHALTLNEYICLLELRATKGEIYSICDFRASAPGNILDLSYNDMTISDTRKIINRHYDDVSKKSLMIYLKHQKAVVHAKAHKKAALMRDITKSRKLFRYSEKSLKKPTRSNISLWYVAVYTKRSMKQTKIKRRLHISRFRYCVST